MRVIAVANSKGGVGKTSTAVNLADGLARDGERVLLVDLDPSGHATTWLLGNKAEAGIAEALEAEELRPDDVVAVGSMWLAPCSPTLERSEVVLGEQFHPETVLAEIIRAPRRPQFDFVVIDSPPSTGLLTRSALYAADGVIVPVLPGDLGMAGFVDVRSLIGQIRKRSKSRVNLLGCLVFQADARETTADETRMSLEQLEPKSVFRSEVRVSAAAKRMPRTRQTSWEPGADDRGLEDYRAILKETRGRLASR